VRLLLDLLDAGVPLADLSVMVGARDRPTAARAAGELQHAIARAVGPLTARIDRLRRLREELVQTREALHVCRACQEPRDALACDRCERMPRVLPRMLYQLFLAPR
jgi:hypothetical protein